jgi:subtilase family serine protease
MSVPADLMPVSFVAPTNIISTRPNPVIQLAWGVTNLGPASASGGWYDAVWFSTNAVLDANSTFVGYFGINQTVPTNGSYWQTNVVTLPMISNGSYTLFLQVDVNNSLYEANLGNNISAGVSGTFTLTPPDLHPLSLVAPATVIYTQPNPAITVNWGVTNQGIGSAAPPWYDRVWFSTNGVLDANSVYLGDFYFNQTVAPGTTYRQTNTVTLPVSGIGNYTLFVQADIYDWIYESNETNNISSPVTVRLLPPLSFNTSATGMRWTSNGFRLQVDGLAGSGLIIYASTNLVSWTPIYTNSSGTGTIQFLDSRATNFPVRFYRAVEQ